MTIQNLYKAAPRIARFSGILIVFLGIAGLSTLISGEESLFSALLFLLCPNPPIYELMFDLTATGLTWVFLFFVGFGTLIGLKHHSIRIPAIVLNLILGLIAFSLIVIKVHVANENFPSATDYNQALYEIKRFVSLVYLLVSLLNIAGLYFAPRFQSPVDDH